MADDTDKRIRTWRYGCKAGHGECQAKAVCGEEV